MTPFEGSGSGFPAESFKRKSLESSTDIDVYRVAFSCGLCGEIIRTVLPHCLKHFYWSDF